MATLPRGCQQRLTWHQSRNSKWLISMLVSAKRGTCRLQRSSDHIWSCVYSGWCCGDQFPGTESPRRSDGGGGCTWADPTPARQETIPRCAQGHRCSFQTCATSTPPPGAFILRTGSFKMLTFPLFVNFLLQRSAIILKTNPNRLMIQFLIYQVCGSALVFLL